MALEDIYNWHEALASCATSGREMESSRASCEKKTIPTLTSCFKNPEESSVLISSHSWVLPARETMVKEMWTRVQGHRRYTVQPLEWLRTLWSKLNLLPYLKPCSKMERHRGAPPLPHAPTALQACNMRAYWWLYPLKTIFNIIVSILIVLQLPNIVTTIHKSN